MQTNLGRFLAKSISTTLKTYEILAREFKDLKAQPTP
jgi:hypothetical protein